jgi:hypothetical protein
MAHGAPIRPFDIGGSRVLVDGRSICSECGRAVLPTGPDEWRHLEEGEPYPERSRWLSPTPAELREAATYADFRATWPRWTTTEAQWREGLRRLELYEDMVAAEREQLPLERGENPYLAIVEVLAEPVADAEGQELVWGLPNGLAQMLDLGARRRELVQLFAWAIPTEEALAAVARYGPLVECGAGTGYWSALLQVRGADVVATDPVAAGTDASEYHRDPVRPWTRVDRLDAVAAVRGHRDRTLLLCWPPFDDDAASHDALRAYRGEVVVHVGEADGASGSERFRRELALNWTLVEAVDLPHWPRLEDRVYVLRRNPVAERQPVGDPCPGCGRLKPPGSRGRSDACFARNPPALALRSGRHRVEYSQAELDALPAPLRKAFQASSSRIV